MSHLSYLHKTRSRLVETISTARLNVLKYPYTALSCGFKSLRHRNTKFYTKRYKIWYSENGRDEKQGAGAFRYNECNEYIFYVAVNPSLSAIVKKRMAQHAEPFIFLLCGEL